MVLKQDDLIHRVDWGRLILNVFKSTLATKLNKVVEPMKLFQTVVTIFGVMLWLDGRKSGTHFYVKSLSQVIIPALGPSGRHAELTEKQV